MIALATIILTLATGAGVQLQTLPADQPKTGKAPLIKVLGKEGVDNVVLDTVFRFAADFNRWPREKRHSARIVGIDQSFPRTLAELSYRVEVTREAEVAEKELRTRLRRFLENFTAFLSGTAKEIVLAKNEKVQTYLEQAARLGECNQIPCPRPPCCKDCSPPIGTPPRCPSPGSAP